MIKCDPFFKKESKKMCSCFSHFPIIADLHSYSLKLCFKPVVKYLMMWLFPKLWMYYIKLFLEVIVIERSFLVPYNVPIVLYVQVVLYLVTSAECLQFEQNAELDISFTLYCEASLADF